MNKYELEVRFLSYYQTICLVLFYHSSSLHNRFQCKTLLDYKKLKANLERIACLGVTDVIKTTSTAVLEVDRCLPHLGLFIVVIAIRTAFATRIARLWGNKEGLH